MRLVWSMQAQRELFDIVDYYDEIDPAIANQIVDRIESAILPLLDFPRMGPTIDSDGDSDGARKWRIPGTPFILLYDVGADRIEVLSVSHARSDWSER